MVSSCQIDQWLPPELFHDLEDFRNSSEWLEIQDYMVGGAGAERGSRGEKT